MTSAEEHQQLPVASRPPVFARTKFLAPQPRTTLVPRDQLVRRLHEADSLPLTIVVGPPGCGKTSLLADWFRHDDDGSIAWLAADRGDEDPERFWHAFIRAVQQVTPSFGVEAADLITLDGHVNSDVLESMLDDDARLDERVRIVLDDFHLVSLAAAQQLQQLLERGLQHLRLIIGSRSDPAVGLYRLRLQRSVCEVRERDLRLDIDETRALVANIGIDPDAVDVQALLDRTEGWAAGVQMAALSVLGTDDPAARVLELAGTTQTIAGYLTTEVLANQPESVRQFLEDTCVVDELDAAMCEALTHQHTSADGAGRVTLEQVEAAHLLLHRIDAAGTVFRYHHLFAEMLRHRLNAGSPERFREQHRLAAEQYERVGNISDAVRHFWHAGRATEGARLLRGHLVNVYLSTGAPPPVDLTILPSDDALRDAPGDAVGYAVGLMLNGHTQLAASLMRRADAARQPGTTPHLDAVHITGARIATELSTGNTETAVRLTREFLMLIDGQELDHDDWVAASIPFGIRAAIWEGELQLAEELADKVRRHVDPRVAGVDVTGALGLLALERGHLETAIELSRGRARDGARPRRRRQRPTRRGPCRPGHRTARHGPPGRSRTRAGDRRPVATARTRPVVRDERHRAPPGSCAPRATSTRPSACSARPGPVSAPRHPARRCSPASTSPRRRCTSCSATSIDRQASPTRCPRASAPQLMRGWVQVLRRNWSAATAVEELLTGRATTLRERFDLSLLRLRIALDREADEAIVGAAASAVLDLAEHTGFVFPVAEAGTDVLHAVAAAARRRPRTHAVERLLLAQPLPRPADQARPQYRVDELSSRELIVLRYMATSMSNQEIADALYLSVNTVKTHIKHVLRKLGASSRTEATKRARELHYL